MSEMKKLFRGLCQEGVEFKDLSEVLVIKNGDDYRDFGKGNMPFYGSDCVVTYMDRFTFDKPSVIAPRGGSQEKTWTEEIVAREQVLREEIARIIAGIEVES